jgi:hypothetical protein
MITPMFGKQPKHKKFNYPFRYYDPEEDEREKQRLKIKRPYGYKKKNHQVRSVVLLALGLAFVIWLITTL